MKTRLFVVFLFGVILLFQGCYTQLALPDYNYSSYRDYKTENDNDEQSYGDETVPEPEYSDTTYDSEDKTIINNYYFDHYHPYYRRFFGYYYPGVTITFGYSSYYDFCWDPWWYINPFYPHIIYYPYPHYYYYYYPWNYYGWNYYWHNYGNYYIYSPRYKYRSNDITRLRGGRERRSSLVTGGRDLLRSREIKRIPSATVDSRDRSNMLDEINPTRNNNTKKNGSNDKDTRVRDIKRLILGDTETGTAQENRRPKDDEITSGKEPAKDKNSSIDKDNPSVNSEPRVTIEKNNGNKRINPYIYLDKKKSITNDGNNDTKKEDKPSFTPRKNDQPQDSNSPKREIPGAKYESPRRDNNEPKYDPPKRETSSPRYNPPRNDNPAPRNSNPPSRSSSPRNDDGRRRR